MNKAYKYIITTGWWCTDNDYIKDRDVKFGDSSIRAGAFHQTWLKMVNSFTNPEKIYIIDSDSPIKPQMDYASEVMISLHNNAGHSTEHKGKLSGVSRAFLLGLSLAMVNEIDYWVYIEQDALIYGKDVIEKCIEKMKSPYMFGSGKGTHQPLQQSFMIIKKEAIPSFVKNFNAIKAKDSQISPEVKFAIATSLLLRIIPEYFYIKMGKSGLLAHFIGTVIRKLFVLFQGFDNLPIGYGRVRPVNFSDSHFYFQHGDKNELDVFMKKIEL